MNKINKIININIIINKITDKIVFKIMNERLITILPTN